MGGTHLGDGDLAELFDVALQGVAELAQALGPEGVIVAPGGGVECRARSGDGGLHVGHGAVGGLPDHLLGGRVDDVESATGTGYELPVDEQLRAGFWLQRHCWSPPSGHVSGLEYEPSVMSASMSSPVSFESTRRRLTTAQAETVNRLTAAAVEVLREVGYDALTVRSVAKRAGVAPATAYTYFSSKGHVVAELFWRRLAEGIADPDPSLPRTERVVTQLRSVALAVEDDTHLARAVTASLLGSDPDVEHLRLRIGVLIRQRLATALGGDPEAPENEALLEALEMLYSGALVRAGMGYETYSAIADRLDAAARLLLENR